MAYVAIGKPVAGDPVKASTLSGVIDNQADSNTRLQLLEGFGDSFEADEDADGIPDGWTPTVYSGGSHALETTDVYHGASSWKLTATAGGGYVEALRDVYLPTATGERIEVLWRLKCGSATVAVKVEVLWYAADESYLSATTLLSSEAGNPTSWAGRRGRALAPTDARWYRLKITTGKSGGSVGASVYWDGVEARVYHGPVTITPVSKTTGTIAISGDVIAGEWPEYAWVRVTLAPVGNAGDLTITGNSITVLDLTVNNENLSWSGLVPLNASLEYTVTSSAGTLTHELIGYVV